MQVTIEMDNLQKIIEATTNTIITETLNETISSIVKSYIKDNYKDIIEEAVNKAIEESIHDYIENTEIYVGNGSFGEEPIITTPRKYINTKINEIFEKEKVTVKKSCSYGSSLTEEISFKEYLDREYDINKTIQQYMDSFGRAFKNELNSYLKKNYDANLRNILCDQIVDLLMQDGKFKSICRGIDDLK